jgi:hypothetical protein
MQSFQFITEFTELEFLVSDEGSQRAKAKTVTIQLGLMNEENQSGFEMDIKSSREIKVLGCGSFSTVKLIGDISSEQVVMKYFTSGSALPDTTEEQVCSRELKEFCYLSHPYIIRVY